MTPNDLVSEGQKIHATYASGIYDTEADHCDLDDWHAKVFRAIADGTLTRPSIIKQIAAIATAIEDLGPSKWYA